MNAIARARYLRISPLKLRKVVKIIRGRKLDDALSILKILPQKAAKMTYKVLFSAKSNYKNRFPESGETPLKIDIITVDQAPILKRMMPRARGRADILHKMSSHLTVIVSGSEAKEAAPAMTKETKAAAETKKPVKKTTAKAKAVKKDSNEKGVK